MKFQHKPEIVEAKQWFKLGDHEDVKKYTYFSDPDYPNLKATCGILDREIGNCSWVHPGDWLVTSSTGTHVMTDVKFKDEYEPVPEDTSYIVVSHYKTIRTKVKQDWDVYPAREKQIKNYELEKVYFVSGKVEEFYGESPYKNPDTYYVRVQSKSEAEADKKGRALIEKSIDRR